jgi:hypothetical protein
MNEMRLERGRKMAYALIQGLRDPEILPKSYPVLFKGGVSSSALHPYALSGLLLLGDRLGYSAVIDSPIFERLDPILIGGGPKRPDSIWFERGGETIRMLIEFEQGRADSLEHKARNLLLASRACDLGLDLLVLIYWILDNQSRPDLTPACEVFKRGFRSEGSRFGPNACPVLVLETIAARQPRDRVSLGGFVAMRFISGGEDKPYVIESLNTPC